MQQLSKYPHLAAYVANLRKIPGGTMQMGYCAANVKERNKMPRITISPFRLGATPVTIAMWVEYCRAAKIDLLKVCICQSRGCMTIGISRLISLCPMSHGLRLWAWTAMAAIALGQAK